MCVEFISRIKNSYHFEIFAIVPNNSNPGRGAHTYKCTDIPGTCPLVAMALREIAVRKVCGDRIINRHLIKNAPLKTMELMI